MDTSIEQLQIETLLDEIKRDAFYPVFQSIIDTEGNTGVEALLRWNEGHHVEESIKCLSTHGYLTWFTYQFCNKLAAELTSCSPDIKFVSINVAPSHVIELTFIRHIYSLWQVCNKLGISLWIELTEDEPYPTGLEEKRFVAQLGVCRGMGIKIALDDYGRGFNIGEQLLSTVRPHIVKLDRTLLKNQCEDSMMWARLRFLARKYHLELLAEGIESQEELSFSRRQGISYYQGFHIGKPQLLSGIEQVRDARYG